MERQPTSVRFSDSERRILDAAARRRGEPRATWVREAALERSVDLLEEELEDLHPSGESGGHE